MPNCKEIVALETCDIVRGIWIRSLSSKAFLRPWLGLSMFQIDSHQVCALLITNRRFVTSPAANERDPFATPILFISP